MAEENFYPNPGGTSEASEDEVETLSDVESTEETALVPKSFLGSKELKVGETCKIKIEHIFEDEVEVSYVPHDSKDKKDKKKSKDDEDDEDDDKPMRHRMMRDDAIGEDEMGDPFSEMK